VSKRQRRAAGSYQTSEAEDLLDRAIRHARDRNVLIVAAAGYEGCAWLHFSEDQS